MRAGSFSDAVLSRMIDQNAPHDLSGYAYEMHLTVQSLVTLSNKAQVSFVHEGCLRK